MENYELANLPDLAQCQFGTAESPHSETAGVRQVEKKKFQEIITLSEIRKTNLNWIPGWFGNWPEYTIVKTTNWFWSFEKDKTGIFVQRSKNIDGVRHSYGGQKRKYPDRPEGRSTFVSNGENILDVVKWIINRGELNNKYQFIRGNHFFASLLYEAITRTKGNR